MGRGSWSLAVTLVGCVEEVGAVLLPRAVLGDGGLFDWQLVDLGLHGVDAPGGLDLGEGLGRVDLAACVVGEAGELLLPGEAELAREGGDGGELLVGDRLRLGVRRGRGGGGWWPGGGRGRGERAACVVGGAGELLLPGEAGLAREGGEGGGLLVGERLRLGARRGRGGGGWWPGGCWGFGDGLPLVGLHRVVSGRRSLLGGLAAGHAPRPRRGSLRRASIGRRRGSRRAVRDFLRAVAHAAARVSGGV